MIRARDDAIKDAAIKHKHQNANQDGPPVSQMKTGRNKEGCQAENDGTGADMNGIAASYDPSAKTAGDPDQRDGLPRTVLRIAQQ